MLSLRISLTDRAPTDGITESEAAERVRVFAGELRPTGPGRQSAGGDVRVLREQQRFELAILRLARTQTDSGKFRIGAMEKSVGNM